MKFILFFQFFVSHFALLDPDPQHSAFGSKTFGHCCAQNTNSSLFLYWKNGLGQKPDTVYFALRQCGSVDPDAILIINLQDANKKLI